MNVKKMIGVTKVTSVILSLCLSFMSVLSAKQAEISTVFVPDNQVDECSENECIEAYQTENSTVMDAYLHQVHYIDQR